MDSFSVWGAILAAGRGSRMGEEIPKQFLPLKKGGDALILRTLSLFLNHPSIDKIAIAINISDKPFWDNILPSFLEKSSSLKPIFFIAGGKERGETLISLVDGIAQLESEKKEAIILSHDGVRPFVSNDAITKSIREVKEKRIVTLALKSTDTTVHSDGKTIQTVLERDKLFNLQTPQSFFLSDFRKTVASLTKEEYKFLTDASSVFLLKGRDVFLIEGESSNIKITTPHDLKIAKTLI